MCRGNSCHHALTVTRETHRQWQQCQGWDSAHAILTLSEATFVLDCTVPSVVLAAARDTAMVCGNAHHHAAISAREQPLLHHMATGAERCFCSFCRLPFRYVRQLRHELDVCASTGMAAPVSQTNGQLECPGAPAVQRWRLLQHCLRVLHPRHKPLQMQTPSHRHQQWTHQSQTKSTST